MGNEFATNYNPSDSMSSPNTRYFATPDQYAGHSLNEIANNPSQFGLAGGFRPDVLANFLGVGEKDPLTKGQTFAYSRNDPGSSEEQFLTKNFTPSQSPSQTALNNQFSKDESTVSNFNNAFQAAVPQIQSKAYAEFGVPDLTTAANALKAQIDTLASNGSNTGAGGYVSQNQVNGALTGPLSTMYAIKANTAANAQNAANNEITTNLTPWTTNATMLNDQMAREMTGFTADQQNQLQAYLGQLQAGTSLTEQQMSDANSLAIAQKNYDATIAQIGAQKGAASYNYIPTSIGGGIFNPATNSFVTGGNSGAPSFSGGVTGGTGTTPKPSITNLESSNTSNNGMSIPGYSGSVQPYNVIPASSPSPSAPPPAIAQSLGLLSGSNNNPNSLGFNSY